MTDPKSPTRTHADYYAMLAHDEIFDSGAELAEAVSALKEAGASKEQAKLAVENALAHWVADLPEVLVRVYGVVV